MMQSRIITLFIIIAVAGCATKKKEPLTYQANTFRLNYEAELPERSMEVRAAEDFRRFCDLANGGDVVSIHRVGLCYMDGYGVPRNEQKGFEAFRHAASLNYTESEYRLALCYAEGIGTPKNDAEALYWMTEAAKKNHPVAGQWLAEQGLHAGEPKVVQVISPHPHHPFPPHHGHPYVLQQETYVGYQGTTAGGNNIGVGVSVRDTYDPRMVKARKEHDKRRSAALQPDIDRYKKEKAEKEQKKKDEEEQKKREEIKTKKSK